MRNICITLALLLAIISCEEKKMGGSLVNDYSNSDSNILSLQDTADKTFFGKIDSINLTNLENSTIPAVAIGSVIENNGALYKFTSEEAISTTDPVTSSTVADGTVYVCLVPVQGTASGSTTDSTGYAIGSTIITLASAGTGTILAGDRVTFTGDTHSYAVSSGDADVSNGGTITLVSPGLLTAIPGSTTAITIISGSLTASFTATAPTWSQEKQGWYGTGGQANYRYIPMKMTKSGSSYSGKEFILLPQIAYYTIPAVEPTSTTKALVNASLSADFETDSSYETIIFNTETVDLDTNYNNSTGVFTAPRDGYYRITVTMYITYDANHGGITNSLRLRKNSTERVLNELKSYVDAGTYQGDTMTISDIVLMSASDTYDCQFKSTVSNDVFISQDAQILIEEINTSIPE